MAANIHLWAVKSVQLTKQRGNLARCRSLSAGYCQWRAGWPLMGINRCSQISKRIAWGIATSLNFPSFVGLDGGLLCASKDRDIGRRHMQAYDDWHADEWRGAYPGRSPPVM
jgi:hypothetical protein